MISNASVYDVAEISALNFAKSLSKRLDNNIWLKREDQQSIFSFKLRGAYNKISHLDDTQKAAGIIAASAGNHAQGVALASQRLNINAKIIMPVTTPAIKVDSVKSMGAEVILSGDNYDEACSYAYKVADQTKRVFIHPYDDIEVIAGQGTIGKELLEQFQDEVDAVFIPVGGGGLIAGVAAWIKQHSPNTKVIGVEPEDASTLYSAMQAGKRVVLPQVGIFADGVAVKQIGVNTFELAKENVDEVILVSIDEICAAIKDIFDDTRVVSEAAGALAVAGVKKYTQRENCKNLNLIAINSGANINFDRLRHVTERTELGEGREGLFAVTIPEKKGSFLKFCKMIGSHSISEFNYRYANNDEAHIFVGIKFQDALDEKPKLISMLSGHGYSVNDLSDNEMAKLHVRHMVGGRSPQLRNELIYRFEFPERPGALLKFLSFMGAQWNITLFHYRNHGAAYGRVLVGAQVPSSEVTAFKQFLVDLGYSFYDETDNPIYRLFLK
ncbi:MAG: threonine ammonia-lyase, biosynthetic [Gammaproteobacteria bacterium]|nr:threonine ammonia-lyase, biosynthetic [Gammaproteobacteria bacterium]